MNLIRTHVVKFPREYGPAPAPRTVTPRPEVVLEERARLEAVERRRRWEAQQRRERAIQAARQKAEAERREQERLERQRIADAQQQADARRAAEAQRAAANRQAMARRRREDLAELAQENRAGQNRQVANLEKWPVDEADVVPTNEEEWFQEEPEQEWAGEFGVESTSIMAQTMQETALQLADNYGPVTQMGQNLRIQAARGFRAGVMRLRNGMYLVVEIHESALDPQFGAASVLVPLAVNAAAKALQNERFQSAVVHTASEGVQAAGRGFKRLGHGHRRDRREQEMPQPPVAPWPALPPGVPGFQYPGYPPAGYLPYAPYVPSPYALLPPVRAGQVQLQAALPWADGHDVARLEGWDDYVD